MTGASRGIGRATALELASAGARVVVGYRQAQAEALGVVAEIERAAVENAEESTQESIEESGAVAIALEVDVTREDDVRALVGETVDRFGSLDVLVCNAGVLDDGLAATMSAESWDRVLAVNLRGAFLCIREAIPVMLRQRHESGNRGSIVTLSSVAARHPSRGHCNYAASKGGLEAMTRALAVELGPKGIRVNGVAPGVIETEMSETVRRRAGDLIRSRSALRRTGWPEEVARAVRFLASDDASYVTGEVLAVSGGYGL